MCVLSFASKFASNLISHSVAHLSHKELIRLGGISSFYDMLIYIFFKRYQMRQYHLSIQYW